MLRKKLGEILVESNYITQQQLDEALQEEETSKEHIGQILIKKGFITKENLAKAMSIQIGMPYIEKITEVMADPDLLSKVPLKFLRQHVIIPVIVDGQKTIITANPNDLQPMDEIALLLKGNINYALSSYEVIMDAINKYYPLEASKEVMEELAEEEGAEIDLGAIEEKDILEMANDAPIIKLVNHILYQAVKENASDIHIESFEKELRIRYRIDGVMYQKLLPPKRYQAAIVSRIKIMAHLNIAEKRLPQDGRINIKIADKPIDIRVSILPSNFGERVVMRLLDKSKGAVDLEKLGFSEHDYKIITTNITRPNGIILVTGPTGSGKTSTLYSILSRLNQPNVTIITVEDPVEYTISGISQVQVNEKVGLTFAAALRSILRQDPDIILIGEIRDKETAQIATQAALTGHLVFSTLHTNSASAAVTRLVDMGIEPFLIASTLICIMAQRLIRKLCDKCKKPYSPSADMLEKLNISPKAAKEITFYEPVGCDECFNTGYKGRIAIFEVLEIEEPIRHLIMENVNSAEIQKKAEELGMNILVNDGIRRIKEGVTTIEEVLSVAYAEQESEE